MSQTLYMNDMIRQIAQLQRTGGSSILAQADIPAAGGHMNGARWYDPSPRTITITGATDTASYGSGGIVQSPPAFSKVFRAAAGVPPDLAHAHIHIK